MKKTEQAKTTSKYDAICQYANDAAKTCENRNFNYFISNPETDTIAITYGVDDKSAFWGLDSSIGEQTMFQWIIAEESPFANRKSLDHKAKELMDNRQWRFDVDFTNGELLKKAMCKRVLLAFAFHFYTCYKCSAEVAELIKDIWKETEATEFDYVDINKDLKCFAETNGGLLKINGRLHDGVIAKLHRNGIRYSIQVENNGHVIVLEKSGTGKPIIDMYRDKNIASAAKCVSPVFYSGAMARVKSIHEQKNYGNERVFCYLFQLESVSYATHLGLKDPRTGNISAYFTEEEQAVLAAYDFRESQLQDELLNKLEEGAEPISAINMYLSQSGYTHGMNTSANIATSDDLLVFTKRGSKTFDSQTLYCSSNGVCELFDENVAFYHHTVDCDLPSIAEAHRFGSFGRELTRESYAELGIYIEPTTWKYYGFTVMGYRSDSKHRFPLHFNILAYGHTESTIKEIRKKSASAVEKEENENVLGIGIALANNWFEALITKLRHGFQMVYGHKDVIADFLILYTVAVLFYDKFTPEQGVWQSIKLAAGNLSYVDWGSLLIAFLTLCFTIVEIKAIIAEALQKHSRTYFFVKSRKKTNNKAIISKCLKRAMKNAGCKKTNPIFTLMFQLYYYQKDKES